MKIFDDAIYNEKKIAPLPDCTNFWSFLASTHNIHLSVIVVAGNATYKSPCRSVGRSVRRSVRPSVGRSVPLYFFGVFELCEGRIPRVLVSYGSLCPCPIHYCPCPTARDRGSCVYGLVIPSRNTHRRSRRSVTSWLSRAYERTIVKKKRQHYTF